MFLVHLATLHDPDLVVPTIAQALGVVDMGGQSLLTHLCDYVAARQLLIVLDNFEQLLSAVPTLAALLASAPRLKLLVTSRAVLHLAGEQAFPVAPLPWSEERGTRNYG